MVFLDVLIRFWIILNQVARVATPVLDVDTYRPLFLLPAAILSIGSGFGGSPSSQFSAIGLPTVTDLVNVSAFPKDLIPFYGSSPAFVILSDYYKTASLDSVDPVSSHSEQDHVFQPCAGGTRYSYTHAQMLNSLDTLSFIAPARATLKQVPNSTRFTSSNITDTSNSSFGTSSRSLGIAPQDQHQHQRQYNTLLQAQLSLAHGPHGLGPPAPSSLAIVIATTTPRAGINNNISSVESQSLHTQSPSLCLGVVDGVSGVSVEERLGAGLGLDADKEVDELVCKLGGEESTREIGRMTGFLGGSIKVLKVLKAVKTLKIYGIIKTLKFLDILKTLKNLLIKTYGSITFKSCIRIFLTIIVKIYRFIDFELCFYDLVLLALLNYITLQHTQIRRSIYRLLLRCIIKLILVNASKLQRMPVWAPALSSIHKVRCDDDSDGKTTILPLLDVVKGEVDDMCVVEEEGIIFEDDLHARTQAHAQVQAQVAAIIDNGTVEEEDKKLAFLSRFRLKTSAPGALAKRDTSGARTGTGSAFRSYSNSVVTSTKSGKDVSGSTLQSGLTTLATNPSSRAYLPIVHSKPQTELGGVVAVPKGACITAVTTATEDTSASVSSTKASDLNLQATLVNGKADSRPKDADAALISTSERKSSDSDSRTSSTTIPSPTEAAQLRSDFDSHSVSASDSASYSSNSGSTSTSTSNTELSSNSSSSSSSSLYNSTTISTDVSSLVSWMTDSSRSDASDTCATSSWSSGSMSMFEVESESREIRSGEKVVKGKDTKGKDMEEEWVIRDVDQEFVKGMVSIDNAAITETTNIMENTKIKTVKNVISGNEYEHDTITTEQQHIQQRTMKEDDTQTSNTNTKHDNIKTSEKGKINDKPMVNSVTPTGTEKTNIEGKDSTKDDTKDDAKGGWLTAQWKTKMKSRSAVLRTAKKPMQFQSQALLELSRAEGSEESSTSANVAEETRTETDSSKETQVNEESEVQPEQIPSSPPPLIQPSAQPTISLPPTPSSPILSNSISSSTPKNAVRILDAPDNVHEELERIASWWNTKYYAGSSSAQSPDWEPATVTAEGDLELMKACCTILPLPDEDEEKALLMDVEEVERMIVIAPYPKSEASKAMAHDEKAQEAQLSTLSTTQPKHTRSFQLAESDTFHDVDTISSVHDTRPIEYNPTDFDSSDDETPPSHSQLRRLPPSRQARNRTLERLKKNFELKGWTPSQKDFWMKRSAIHAASVAAIMFGWSYREEILPADAEEFAAENQGGAERKRTMITVNPVGKKESIYHALHTRGERSPAIPMGSVPWPLVDRPTEIEFDGPPNKIDQMTPRRLFKKLLKEYGIARMKSGIMQDAIAPFRPKCVVRSQEEAKAERKRKRMEARMRMAGYDFTQDEAGATLDASVDVSQVASTSLPSSSQLGSELVDSNPPRRPKKPRKRFNRNGNLRGVFKVWLAEKEAFDLEFPTASTSTASNGFMDESSDEDADDYVFIPRSPATSSNPAPLQDPSISEDVVEVSSSAKGKERAW